MDRDKIKGEVGQISAGKRANGSPFWRIERCRDCPNAVIDTAALESELNRIMEVGDFAARRRQALGTDRPTHHQVVRLSISGCPNSCSQPQIKDVGIQGQAVPEVGEGCALCGRCVEECPDGAITLTDSGPALDRDFCLNCGRCSGVCPAGVITISHRGYRVLVGGKLGRHPRLAETAVALGGKKDLRRVLAAIVELLTDSVHASQRLGSALEELGLANFKKMAGFTGGDAKINSVCQMDGQATGPNGC